MKITKKFFRKTRKTTYLPLCPRREQNGMGGTWGEQHSMEAIAGLQKLFSSAVHVHTYKIEMIYTGIHA